MKLVSINDIAQPEQKYIHFWDFMELDEKVHEFQARMLIAMRELKKDIKERYRNYYTRAYVQTPDKFIRHNKELQEFEYLIGNPFFLALLHFALTKEMDEKELRYWAIVCKRLLMDRRMAIKENIETIEKKMKDGRGFLVR